MPDIAEIIAPTIEELLQARFAESDHKVRKGRGGMNFTYVEDEAVMQRLDDCLGFGNWSLGVEAINVEKGIALVSLHVHWNGRQATFEDFGYCNNADGEAPLKEAVTDGIRRVGRMAGIARYVYAGEAPAPEAATPKPSQSPASGLPISGAQRNLLFAKLHDVLGEDYTDERAKLAVFMACGKRSTHQMTPADLDKVIDALTQEDFVTELKGAKPA